MCVEKKRREIAEFIIAERNLDVLAITKSWLKGTGEDKAVINELIPLGFELQHIARPKKRGGGVAVIYRSSI